MFWVRVFAFLVSVSCYSVFCAITEDQMRSSGAMVRNVCQPKFKVPDDVADGIREGIFPNDKGGKCYIHCVLEMMSMMKKNKMNYDAAMKQFDLLLPDSYREPYKSALTACKDSNAGIKDACDAALTILKCFYANNSKYTFA